MADSPVLLAVSHGTSSDAGARAISQLVAAVRHAASDVEVMEAFVDVQQPDVPAALAKLGARKVVVVPLLLSAGYHVRVDIARAVRQAGGGALIADAMGPDPRLARVLARKVAAVAAMTVDGPCDVEQVLLCAAGSSDNNAAVSCEQLGDLLAEELGLPVSTAFLSASRPLLPDVLGTINDAHHCVVSTYLLATGYFDRLAGQHCDSVKGLRRTLPLLSVDEEPPTELVELVLDRYEQAILR